MVWRIAADSKAREPAALNQQAENRLEGNFESEIRGAGGVRRLLRDQGRIASRIRTAGTRLPQHNRIAQGIAAMSGNAELKLVTGMHSYRTHSRRRIASLDASSSITQRKRERRYRAGS